MFGIGKILGGALKAIGLEELAPFVSLAANVFTGNWAGVAQDVMGLVSTFSNSDFAGNIARQNPVGGFDAAENNRQSGGLLGGLLKGKIGRVINTFGKAVGAFRDLQSGNFTGAAKKAFDCFTTVKGYVDDQQSLNSRALYARQSNIAG